VSDTVKDAIEVIKDLSSALEVSRADATRAWGIANAAVKAQAKAEAEVSALKLELSTRRPM
jgi:hypothetical protein